jgi:hypothetical protein
MKQIKRLRITEISAVDRPAQEHARAVIMKRNEEVNMSASSRCPTCGQKVPEPDDEDEIDTDKRHDPETIAKAATMSAESIIKSYRDKMSGASEAAVLSAATSSPEFMKLHMDEKMARQRAMGNI